MRDVPVMKDALRMDDMTCRFLLLFRFDLLLVRIGGFRPSLIISQATTGAVESFPFPVALRALWKMEG